VNYLKINGSYLLQKNRILINGKFNPILGKFNVYKDLCTLTDPTPYPPESTGKEATQYWFSSLTSPALGQIYNIWYKEIDGKSIKILPDSIESILTSVGLAHWIQGDGYWSEGTVLLCTDNFTEEETKRLISLLENKFGLKALKEE
jgi:hypothetical protein